MCILELLRYFADKSHADLVMLFQIMLSNDLYAGQENLEGDQLENENRFWRKILKQNTIISVQLLEMFLSIKSQQNQEVILTHIYHGTLGLKGAPVNHELNEFLINSILGANEEDQNPLIRRLKAWILFNVTIETQSSRTKELSQNFELLSGSSNQARNFIDEIYRDKFTPSQMAKS